MKQRTYLVDVPSEDINCSQELQSWKLFRNYTK